VARILETELYLHVLTTRDGGELSPTEQILGITLFESYLGLNGICPVLRYLGHIPHPSMDGTAYLRFSHELMWG
jgi:hypothetical protein